MGDNVDPEDPRPTGHYQLDRDAEWYYGDDDHARGHHSWDSHRRQAG